MLDSFLRYEKEFDGVQDVFELQVHHPPLAPLKADFTLDGWADHGLSCTAQLK